MKNLYEVYIHTCPNSKVYIGIAQNSVRRWGRDGKGYKRHPYFYNAISKYGWENIKHEILFTHLTFKEACAKEKELIVLHKSNQHDYGYNMTAGGEGSDSRKYSDETLKKMHKPYRCKTVYQYDLDYNLITVYEGKYEAARNLGCIPSSIKNVCDKIGYTAKGYIFTTTLLSENDIACRKKTIAERRNNQAQKLSIASSNVSDITKYKRIVTRNKNRVAKGLPPIQPKYKTIVKVYQYDENGELVGEYKSFSEAERVTKIDRKKIATVCNNKKLCGGYYWERENVQVLKQNPINWTDRLGGVVRLYY